MEKEKVKEQFITLLKQSNMSIQRIAKASGVNRGTINNWYYGNTMPTIDKAVAALEAVGYKVTVSDKED